MLNCWIYLCCLVSFFFVNLGFEILFGESVYEFERGWFLLEVLFRVMVFVDCEDIRIF